MSTHIQPPPHVQTRTGTCRRATLPQPGARAPPSETMASETAPQRHEHPRSMRAGRSRTHSPGGTAPHLAHGCAHFIHHFIRSTLAGSTSQHAGLDIRNPAALAGAYDNTADPRPSAASTPTTRLLRRMIRNYGAALAQKKTRRDQTLMNFRRPPTCAATSALSKNPSTSEGRTRARRRQDTRSLLLDARRPRGSVVHRLWATWWI